MIINKVRLTNQKRILQASIDSLSSIFSAEEIYLKVEDKGIGQATVYRFLKNLEEKGKIHSYLCNNKKIYSTKTAMHIHFTCEKCNTVKHLTTKNVDFLREIVVDKICHFQINVTGICKNCS